MADANRAAQVIKEILRIAGKVDETHLYKMFYFAHLLYAQDHPDFLTDWPIVKMPYGPGIDRFRFLLDVLGDEVEFQKTHIGPYPATEYRLKKETHPADLPPEAIDSIKRAVDFASGMTSAELSDLTHKFSHSWRKASSGQELNIYVDLLTDEEYERNKQQFNTLSVELRDAMAET